ncbi:MAG: 2-phospho-L-lactate guanylyltransferase [Anaerolineales bacterium]|nr:2-phospho-L-lactate guanylyltransferase [Anaerolineales bacterium]
MKIWTIVPVKPLKNGKSRLSDLLDDIQRENLNTYLLERTLKILKQIEKIEQIIVVSDDETVLETVAKMNCFPVRESLEHDLNPAIQQAFDIARERGAEQVLILPADLPLVTVEDVCLLLEKAGEKLIVISPDRHEKGTNALVLPTNAPFQFEYGEESFQRHQSVVKELGMTLKIVNNPDIGFDIDTPQDFIELESKLENRF